MVAGEFKESSIPSQQLLSGYFSVHVAAAHNDEYKTEGKNWYVKMIRKALMHAIHTKNMCVFLTNHNYARFMEVGAHSERSG